jgi:ribonuclease G
MAIEVLIQAGAGEIRIATLAEGKLEELSFERSIGEDHARGCHSLIGDIVLGRVRRVMAGMQAAFIEIGGLRDGFLALRDARMLAKKDDPEIGDCLREGDSVLVQVIKDPIGEKGARLSAAVTLPGRLLVMTPGQPEINLSRRIEDENVRAGLIGLGKKLLAEPGLVSGAGYIFRAVAIEASLENLAQDALGLAEIWRGIEEKRKTARPPATLYHDLGPIERTLRDHVRGAVTRVVLDDAGAAESARAYCRRAMPEAEKLIELTSTPVFDGLEDEIAALALPRVQLASGGWITIETTEALTAIDVNSGRFAGGGLEETSHAVNLEAAGEIGRQIRLRGIGGLIVVDFIQLRDAEHVAEILAALEQSLSFDRAPVMVSPMSAFGIVAITRKRVREPLGHLTGVPCAACGGAGRMPSRESVAFQLLRRVEREARATPGREIVAEAAPDVAEWLNAHLGQITPELARRGAGRVRFAAGDFGREEFDVRAV